MDKTRIIRTYKQDNYSILSNCPLKNKNISLKATGLMAYLLSLPEDWEIILSEIEQHKTDGRDSFRSAFKECMEAGYIDKITDRVNGRFFVTYIIYESLSVKNLKLKEKEESLFSGYSGFAQNGFSGAVKPTRLNRHGKTDAENPKLLITNEIKTNKLITEKLITNELKEKKEKININHDLIFFKWKRFLEWSKQRLTTTTYQSLQSISYEILNDSIVINQNPSELLKKIITQYFSEEVKPPVMIIFSQKAVGYE